MIICINCYATTSLSISLLYCHVDCSEQHQAAKKETYNASNDPYFHRGITFTRAFTNDVSESFKRTFTHTFGDIQLDIDDDEVR